MIPDRVTIKKFCELTGYRETEVHRNIGSGLFRLGWVLRLGPNREKLISIEAFNKWAAGPAGKLKRRAISKAAWSKANAGKVVAYTRARQTAQLQRTPPWADLDAITAIYEQANRVSRETGVKHHVDHIVPLRGKEVSGLHVPWNLRIVPARENQHKHNKLLP